MERDKATLETWNKLADLYQEKFMDMDLYDSTYDLFCESIQKREPNVLEVGCGPGNITKYLLHKRRDLKIDASDSSPNMIRLAKENNPTANFIVLDCRDINTLTKKYDAVVCGFCMPYLSKEECIQFIKDASALSNKNAIIYFSFIEDDYSRSAYETSSNGEHTLFVYYHERTYLKKALIENSFELMNTVSLDYQTAKGNSKHSIVMAKKI